MSDGARSAERPPFAAGVIGAAAAVKLALHLATNVVTPYGFHRDEFLYFAMGRHLQLWRMDFPPGIALIARSVRATLGDSLPALRLVPAVAGVLVLLLAALVARELGGGRWAQGLAALAVLASPLFLRSANLFQPVVLDQLTWTAALYALVRLCRDDRPRWWLVLGTALGTGLLAKFSAALLGVGLLLGLLSSERRRWILTPWPWIAGLIALAIGSPSLVGQLRLGFPVIGQMADLRASQLERVTPLEFLGEQLLWGPSTLLALIGLVGLIASTRLREYRVIGWVVLWTLGILMLLHGKSYYAGPLQPALLGAGGVMLEQIRHPLRGGTVRWGTALALAAFLTVVFPLGVPILPPERMARYALALGVTAARRTNTGEVEQLPQDYADMLGWEAMVGAVAEAYRALPPPEKERAVVVAGNYGEAGALDFFGPGLGLPAPVSPAGSFWFFGPGDKPGDVAITVGIDRGPLDSLFDSVRVAGRIENRWGVAEERDLTIFVATGPRRTLQELWPSLAGRN